MQKQTLIIQKKSGYAAIIGRPNAGKSTLLNNILGHKVSITSPKPQTTRNPVEAVFEDDRGQIIFIDTPGMFRSVEDPVSRKINPLAERTVHTRADVVIHLVDHTRERDDEENKILGIVRKIHKPKILAINKSDIKKPSFTSQYRFMEGEYNRVVTISGMYKSNLNYLMDAVFEFLPVGDPIVEPGPRPTPLINQDSKTFISEIIREKAYLFLRKEVPYTLTVHVDTLENRSEHLMYVKARIITNSDRYKKMIIGEKGRMIKEIGMAARKELETATSRKFYIDLTVEVNTHWMDTL